MTLKKMLAAGVVSLIAMGSAGAANAGGVAVEFGNGATLTVQSGYYGGWYDYRDHDRRYRTLSPKDVRHILRDRGFRQIDYIDKRGTTYQVRAVDYRGKRVGLVVNARNGHIVTAYRLR